MRGALRDDVRDAIERADMSAYAGHSSGSEYIRALHHAVMDVLRYHATAVVIPGLTGIWLVIPAGTPEHPAPGFEPAARKPVSDA